MKKNSRRLDQLQSAMEPQQNALVWLEYFKNNEPLPASFWKLRDPNAVSALTNQVMNAYAILGLWIQWAETQTAKLELMLGTVQMAGLASDWCTDAVQDLEAAGGTSMSRRVAAWEAHRHFLEAALAPMSDGLRKGWNATWENLRVAELAAADVGEDFLGRDILVEEARRVLLDVRTRLEELRATLKIFRIRVERREPSEETMTSLLSWLRRTG